MAPSDENSHSLRMLGSGLSEGVPMEGVQYPNPNRALRGIENLIYGQPPTLAVAKRPLQEGEVIDPKTTHGALCGQCPITRQFTSTLKRRRPSGSIYGENEIERQHKREKREMAVAQNLVAAYYSSNGRYYYDKETAECKHIDIEMKDVEEEEEKEEKEDKIISDIDISELKTPLAVARSDENSLCSMLAAGLVQGISVEGVRFSILTRNPNPSPNRRPQSGIRNLINSQEPGVIIGKHPFQDAELTDWKFTNGALYGKRRITRIFAAALQCQSQSRSVYEETAECKHIDIEMKDVEEEKEDKIISDIDISELKTPLAVARSDKNSLCSKLAAGLVQGLSVEGVRYSILTRNPNPSPNRRSLCGIKNLIHSPESGGIVGKHPLQEAEVTDWKFTKGALYGKRRITRIFAAALQCQSQSRSVYEEIVNERQQKRGAAVAKETAELKRVDIEMKDINEDLEEDDGEDIDGPDLNNPLAVVEYVDEIQELYWRIEHLGCVDLKYMSLQSDINEKMRGILIDWLIEVHYKMELLDETLFLTVNLIDRFLALQNVARKKLQLVGVTALLLACKYQDVTVPVVEDLILICDCAYTRVELLQMERLMVNTLQFYMSVPTPYVFMMRFLKAAQANKQLELLSFFMVELCLSEYKMLQFRPSLLAAAAIFTAQCTLDGMQYWSKCCEVHSRYIQEQLMECSRLMVELHRKAGQGKLTAVHRKFHTPKYGCVSKCEPALFLLDTGV